MIDILYFAVYLWLMAVAIRLVYIGYISVGHVRMNRVEELRPEWNDSRIYRLRMSRKPVIHQDISDPWLLTNAQVLDILPEHVREGMLR